jgi:cell division transport system permease protein
MVKARTFGYFFKSSGRSLARNSWMTIASISTVAISLLVLGVFLLLAVNVGVAAQHMESQIEVTAYLLDMPRDHVQRLEQQVRSISGVSEVYHVSKDEAWERLLEWYGNDRTFLAGWEEENPLRESFEIRAESPELVSEIAGRVAGLSGVEEVVFGRELIEQILAITSAIRMVGTGLMIGLALAAMFIIANTIRIAVFSRRREISIMRYVGATKWFIRWPFIIEGWVLGLIGGVVASSILAWGYYLAVRYLLRVMPFWPLIAPWPFLQQLALGMLGIGSLIGIAGSALSLRRYLNV